MLGSTGGIVSALPCMDALPWMRAKPQVREGTLPGGTSDGFSQMNTIWQGHTTPRWECRGEKLHGCSTTQPTILKQH